MRPQRRLTEDSDFRRAFTLVEMLMVIAIIAALAAILLPTASKVRTQSRSTVCQSNMRQIYQGQQIWRTTNKAEQELSFENWRGTIASSLASSKVWACPEDDDQTGLAESVYFNYALRVKDKDFNDLGYSLELHEGPYCDKKNASGNSYELHMDDEIGGGDNARNDVIVYVTDLGGGKFTLGLKSNSQTGYHFDLLDTLTGQVIKANMGDDGQIVTINNAEGSKVSYGMVGHAYPKEIKPLQHINANYGNADRIYLMDYPLMQVIVAPDDRMHKWNEPFFQGSLGKVKFARHGDKINVLMGDGHSQSFTRNQIDPQNQVDPSIPELWKLGP